MNRERRKELQRIAGLVEALRATIDEAREALQAVQDDERDYFDAMPEAFQSGAKGEAAEAAVSAIDDATCALDEIDIDAILIAIETAQE